jgi:acetyl esterase/lipase
MARFGPRHIVAPLVAVITLLVSACQSEHGGQPASSADRSAPEVSTSEYLPALEEDLYLPSGSDSSTVPLVVMIPGGAWVTADRSGLAPLASYLSARGIAVANATIRGASAGFRFPGPVQDVMCAVDGAADALHQRGLTPRPVVAMGHSSGAHLAALAALGAVGERGDCPHPATSIDAAALLSGLYDLALVSDVAEPLLGTTPTADPAGWHAASASTWVASRPELPVYLAHGEHDELVPVTFTEAFAAALDQAGHPVRVDLVAGAGHHEIYLPEVIGADLVAWISSLG